jgi:diguanylate cyclase (GGDEF)-like protein
MKLSDCLQQGSFTTDERLAARDRKWVKGQLKEAKGYLTEVRGAIAREKWNGLPGNEKNLTQAEIKNLAKQAGAPRQEVVEALKGAKEGDRRVNPDLRAYWSSLSAEEQASKALLEPNTLLPNKMAWKNTPKAPFVAEVDVDGLKWVNDNMGHLAGDELLQKLGKALNDAAPGKVYHIGGDEFAIRGNSAEEIEAAVSKAKELLKGVKISSGKYTYTGPTFGYGVAADYKTADTNLQARKEADTKAGLRPERGTQPKTVTRNTNTASTQEDPKAVLTDEQKFLFLTTEIELIKDKAFHNMDLTQQQAKELKALNSYVRKKLKADPSQRQEILKKANDQAWEILEPEEIVTEAIPVPEEGIVKEATEVTPEHEILKKEEEWKEELPPPEENLEGALAEDSDPLVQAILKRDPEEIWNEAMAFPLADAKMALLGAKRRAEKLAKKHGLTGVEEAANEVANDLTKREGLDPYYKVKGERKKHPFQWNYAAEGVKTIQTGKHEGDEYHITELTGDIHGKQWLASVTNKDGQHTALNEGKVFKSAGAAKTFISESLAPVQEGVTIHALGKVYDSRKVDGLKPTNKKIPFKAELENGEVKWFASHAQAAQYAETKKEGAAIKRATRTLKDFFGEELSEKIAEAQVKEKIKESKDAKEILTRLSKSKDKMISGLASAIKNVYGDKLKKVAVEFNPAAENYYDMQANKISLDDEASQVVQLHEVVHALTAKEMLSNPELAKEVMGMRDTFEHYALVNGLITKEELVAFKEDPESHIDLPEETFDILYALQSTFEFMAVGMTSERVQGHLAKIKAEVGEGKKGLWHSFVELIRKAIGLPGLPGKFTQLDKLLTIFAELANAKADKSADIILPAVDYKKEARLAVAAKKSQKGSYTFLKGLKDLGKTYGEGAIDRLERISPKISTIVRKMEFNLAQDEKRMREVINPWLKQVKALSDLDKAELALALSNGEPKVLKDKKLEETYKGVQEVLSELEGRAMDAGLLYEKLENYFPRRVKDFDGLIQYLKEREMKNKGREFKGEYTRLQREIETARKEAKLKGMPFGKADEIQVVNDILRSGHYTHIPRPGSTKERSLGIITGETMAFYADPVEAITAHLYEMTERISIAEMMGSTPRKTQMRELRKRGKEIEQKMAKGENADTLMNEWQELAEQLDDYDKNLETSVAAMVTEHVKGDKQQEAIDIIRARAKQRGAHGVASDFRNFTYLMTLTSPTSALTQLGDLGLTLFKYGPIDAMKGMGQSIASLVRKQGITQQDFDFGRSQSDFSSGSLATTLDKALTWSGLKTMDIFGKETLMQTSFNKWTREAKKGNLKEFKEKWGRIFDDPRVEGDLTAKVFEDLRKGEKSADVLYLLYSDLMDTQPIALSTLPVGYLEGGNLRLFYMLKTFSVRFLNFAYSGVKRDFERGDKAKGILRLANLMLIMGAAGAGADELKDWLMGRDSVDTFSDSVGENMLQLLMLNRYSLKQGVSKESLITSTINGWMPPFRYADDFSADVWAIAMGEEGDFKAKSLRNISYGRLAWERTDAGREAQIKREKRELLEKAEKGTRVSDLRVQMNNHNRKALELGFKDQLVTMSQLQGAARGAAKGN